MGADCVVSVSRLDVHGLMSLDLYSFHDRSMACIFRGIAGFLITFSSPVGALRAGHCWTSPASVHTLTYFGGTQATEFMNSTLALFTICCSGNFVRITTMTASSPNKQAGVFVLIVDRSGLHDLYHGGIHVHTVLLKTAFQSIPCRPEATSNPWLSDFCTNRTVRHAGDRIYEISVDSPGMLL